MTPALRVGDLTAWYGPAAALRNITIEVQPNEAVALLGANGAGKTTLLSSIARLHRKVDGRILLDGDDITREATSAVAMRGVSYARERAPVITKMSVDENIRMGEMLARRRGREPLERDLLWDYFPILAEKAGDHAGLLSGGQRQMLALAIAFVSRPRLLLLDEPSAGLSPIVAGPVFEAIHRMCSEGVSLLLAEQNADWVQGMATRAYMLENGRIAQSGTVDAFV